MSTCQNESSCVACCGTLNLRITVPELRALLTERTQSCPTRKPVDHHSLVAYRNMQEERESALQRYDETVYVCPFVGYLTGNRIGCMIHPICTGQILSQNASFYGTTICQSYDCRCKEIEERQPSGWVDLAVSLSEGDALVYTRIIGDAMFYRLVEAIGNLPSLLQAAIQPMQGLVQLRLRQDCGPTSFELPGQSKPTVDDLLPALFREEDRTMAAGLIAEAIDAVGKSQKMQR